MVAPRPRHPTAPSPSHRTSVAATPSDREARGGVQRTEETRQLTGACEDTHLPLPQSERQRSVAQQTADRPWSLPPPLRLRPRTWPRRRRGLPRSRLRPGASPARSPPPRPSRPPSGQSPRQTRHLRRLRGRATGAGRPTGSARPTASAATGWSGCGRAVVALAAAAAVSGAGGVGHVWAAAHPAATYVSRRKAAPCWARRPDAVVGCAESAPVREVGAHFCESWARPFRGILRRIPALHQHRRPAGARAPRPEQTPYGQQGGIRTAFQARLEGVVLKLK